jgi:uncharacterized membrane-anchored protein YjiN (DUF445 family)
VGALEVGNPEYHKVIRRTEMSIKDDLLEVLESSEGQEALKKAVEEALEKAVDGALLETLQSDDGQEALKTAARNVLREGFAGHAPGLTEAQKKLVASSQKWLFDTVEKIRKKVNA